MTTATEQRTWQDLVSEYLDEEHEPHLRMSASGHCVRALTYADGEAPESNAADVHGENRMAMGHMAEVLIVRNLHLSGWETRHTALSPGGQLELRLELPETERRPTGHPDGVCRHKEFTRGLWVTLECKSMSVQKGLEVQDMGVAHVYPHYMAQIGLYGRRLHEMGEVSHPGRGVFAMMDRDGRPMPPERVSWEPESVDAIIEKMSDAARHTDRGELPERPFEKGSKECGFCSYHTLCWGASKPPGGRPDAVETRDPELVEAARTWSELDPKVKAAKARLQRASDEADGADIAADGVIGGYFHPREPKYSADRLEKLVPADVLRKCAPAPAAKDAYWVRKARR